MVVRRLALGFKLPRKDPRTDNGIGMICIRTLAPDARMGYPSLLKNIATVRINTVSIVPDSKPEVRTDALQSLFEINPAAMDTTQIDMIETGAIELNGSFVLNVISATKKEMTSIPSSDTPTDNAESLRRSDRSEP
jgi:hypothetical protein